MARPAAALALAVFLALLPCPAWAHDPESTSTTYSPPPNMLPVIGDPSPPATTIVGSSPAASGVWPLLLLAPAVILAGRARPRRVAIGLLVVGLAVLSVETAVHSVHHLGDQERATTCDVAAIAGQLVIVAPDAIVVDPALVVAMRSSPENSPSAWKGLHHPPARGRAPPTSPSA